MCIRKIRLIQACGAVLLKTHLLSAHSVLRTFCSEGAHTPLHVFPCKVGVAGWSERLVRQGLSCVLSNKVTYTKLISKTWSSGVLLATSSWSSESRSLFTQVILPEVKDESHHHLVLLQASRRSRQHSVKREKARFMATIRSPTQNVVSPCVLGICRLTWTWNAVWGWSGGLS